MAITCSAPDPTLGVVLRLSRYFDCEGRALGENGFQSLVGGPAWATLLVSVVTVFIALIGYRMILGTSPSLRDGVGWAVRLGVVLTLVTGWTAFQTVVYRATVDAPNDLAATILPASGLSPAELAPRLQDAYERLRLGRFGTQIDTTVVQPPGPESGSTSPAAFPGIRPAGTLPAAPAPANAVQRYGQLPLPQTAMLFAVATLGIAGGLHIASGLLIAIAPLAILGLLFDSTLDVFSGWARALAGVTLGTLTATVASSIALAALDAQFAELDAIPAAVASALRDPGGLTVTVAVSFVVTLLLLAAAMRAASAFRLPAFRQAVAPAFETRAWLQTQSPRNSLTPATSQLQPLSPASPPSRAASVAQALDLTVRREGGYTAASSAAPGRAAVVSQASGRDRISAVGGTPLGIAGRRSVGRKTQSAARRDRVQ